ncbi:MAG: hypothetical protein ACOCYP_09265 [Planctomycetota bacterium]
MATKRIRDPKRRRRRAVIGASITLVLCAPLLYVSYPVVAETHGRLERMKRNERSLGESASRLRRPSWRASEDGRGNARFLLERKHGTWLLLALVGGVGSVWSILILIGPAVLAWARGLRAAWSDIDE